MKIGKFLFGLVLFVSCGIASESSYDVVKLLKEIRSDIEIAKNIHLETQFVNK